MRDWRLLFFLLPGVLLLACERGEESAPAVTEDAEAISELPERPASHVPRWLDGEGEGHFDEHGARFIDLVEAKHAVFAVGSASRDSELAHEKFRPALADEDQAHRGRLWLELVRLSGDFAPDAGGMAPYQVATPAGWAPEGQPRLGDYASAVYAYHMHHRAGRWARHGLEDSLTYYPAAYFTGLVRQVLQHQYADGRFYADPGYAQFDAASMAAGLAAVHPAFYAWYRWQKDEGAGDMGQLKREQLDAWLGVGPNDLLVIAWEIAGVLDAAWDEDHGIYALDGPEWDLLALGQLLRGKKALWEHLYVFGDEHDRELARQLYERSLRVLAGVAEVMQPRGLPARIRFGADGAEAATREVDVAAHWGLLRHLVAGYALVREREGAGFLAADDSNPREWIGELVDTAIAAHSTHIRDGRLISRLDADSGEVLDDRTSTVAVGAFAVAALEGYRLGSAYDRPDAWADNAELAERSRALYRAVLEQTGGLEHQLSALHK